MYVYINEKEKRKKVEKDYGFVSLDSESLISPVYIRISRKICTLHIRRHTGYYTKKKSMQFSYIVENI